MYDAQYSHYFVFTYTFQPTFNFVLVPPPQTTTLCSVLQCYLQHSWSNNFPGNFQWMYLMICSDDCLFWCTFQRFVSNICIIDHKIILITLLILKCYKCFHKSTGSIISCSVSIVIALGCVFATDFLYEIKQIQSNYGEEWVVIFYL